MEISMGLETGEIQIAAAKGLALCREGDWDRGLQLLGAAAEGRKGGAELPGLVYSYLGYGIARHQRRVRDGLKLCEHAVKIQYYEPENHLNLARVQLMLQDRKAAVASIARGLKLDPNHRGLKDLRVEIGVRRRPVLPFLSRTNPINILLGRLRRGFSGG
jgi:tetratricopeptide (TPR) repeat protein